MARGILIVFEGADKTGKTTQCKNLVEILNRNKIKSKYLNFPNRTTIIGNILSEYLKNKIEISDESVHLLFSANRWEFKNTILQELNSGTTLLVDRYSFSGIAYSAAKGLNLEWCKLSEINLPKPDLVLYFTKSLCNYESEERFEVNFFQQKVQKTFEKLYDESYWCLVNNDKPINNLSIELFVLIKNTIMLHKNSKITNLC